MLISSATFDCFLKLLLKLKLLKRGDTTRVSVENGLILLTRSYKLSLAISDLKRTKTIVWK